MKWLLFAAAMSLAPPARATVLMPLSTDELTDHADRVVLGVVVAREARWNHDHSVIFTEAAVRVTRSYKGAARVGDVIAVRAEGGSSDGVGMRVVGAATFSVGEEVLLFLETRGSSTWTVGMTLGKLGVTTGGDGVKRVAASVSGVAWAHAPSDDFAAEMQPRRLDAVERVIRDRVRSQ